MRRWSFVLSFLGLFVLSLFFGFDRGEVEGLHGLEINEKVLVRGEVVRERILYFGTKLLMLDSGIEIVCECSGTFDGRKIFVEGLVEEYDGRKQVRALEIIS